MTEVPKTGKGYLSEGVGRGSDFNVFGFNFNTHHLLSGAATWTLLTLFPSPLVSYGSHSTLGNQDPHTSSRHTRCPP